MPLSVGLVVPHIFMQDDILPNVIFSPGELAKDLADELVNKAVDVTLFSPGQVTTKAKNITANLEPFKSELSLRGDTYLELLKKHPLTFITLARQVQSELIARAYELANQDQFDVIHIYTNEEDIALPFAQFCKKPVVFTHHDPFNFLVGYRANFPKYKDLNWLSISNSQRTSMPQDTNWIGNIYHGLDEDIWPQQTVKKADYVAFIGRVIEPKGVHLAIQAVQHYNQTAKTPLRLKIAGKHYHGDSKNSYWQTTIEPLLEDPNIEYVGFIKDIAKKQAFLSKAKALLIPSTFAEPFGMVMIEALACSTPVIGLNSGAIPEVISEGKTGFIVKKRMLKNASGKEVVDTDTIYELAETLRKINTLDPDDCRAEFIKRYTLEKMASGHKKVYEEVKASSC